MRLLGMSMLSLAAAACSGGSLNSQGAASSSAGAAGTQSRTSDFANVASAAGIPRAPAGERLYMVRDGSIWSMSANGSDPDQVTVRHLEIPDERPAVSPSGTELVFASSRKGPHKLFVVSLEELLMEPLTDGSDGGDDAPTYSPDGKSIAFVRGDPRERRDLCIVDRATKKVDVVLIGFDDEPTWVGFPSFSPDGKRLVFSADRRKGAGTNLWLLDLETKKTKRLTESRSGAPFTADIHPDWSPDGNRIAFASNRHVASKDDEGDFDIYVVNPDGSGLSRLTRDAGTAKQPAYSTDGKRLFFTSTRDRKHAFESEIYVMPATGGQQLRFTRDERPQNSSPVSGRRK